MSWHDQHVKAMMRRANAAEGSAERAQAEAEVREIEAAAARDFAFMLRKCGEQNARDFRWALVGLVKESLAELNEKVEVLAEAVVRIEQGGPDRC